MKTLKLIPLFLILSFQLFSQVSYNLRGDWNHNGNGHGTKLVVAEQNGNKFSGTMHGNPLINGQINGNKVTFTRDISQRQDYTGTITVDKDGTIKMSGTFTQLGTSTIYKWNSEKIGKTSPPTPTPVNNDAYNLRGDWNHNGNGHATKLVVAEQNGNKFSGTMHGNPLINGQINGNKVTFTRDISQRQDYTGTITVDKDGTIKMSGTFTQLGTSTIYKWNSEKIGKTSPPTPTPVNNDAYNLRGDWNHNGNGHATKLVVAEQNGNKFSGTMHGNPLINGQINGNKVTFTRDISQRQDYTGTITVDKDGTIKMSGTFTQLGTSTIYKWNSEKIGKTSPPTPTPVNNDAYNLRGDWNHNGNGHGTKLVVAEQNGNKFSGTMHGNPLINGQINGNKVTFTRDISQRQDYTGTITVDKDGTIKMSGTFTQLGTSTIYKWNSEKVEKQKN